MPAGNLGPMDSGDGLTTLGSTGPGTQAGRSRLHPFADEPWHTFDPAGPAHEPAPVRFVASEPVLIADAGTRRGHDLGYWIDGTVGFHRGPAGSFAVAPNGRNLSIHHLPDGTANATATSPDLLAGLRATDAPIRGLPDDVEHASGGPVIVDPDTGTTLLVYHGETFTDGDATDFYSFLGLAVRDDDGAFVDLGRVVESDIAESTPVRLRPMEIGPGGCIVHDGWLQVYFNERDRVGVRGHLGVARARLADVVDAARARRTPVFDKLSGTGWDAAGVGGRAADLFSETPLPVMWFDLARLESLDSYLLVFSTVRRYDGAGWRWLHATSLSADGLRWSQPVPLSDPDQPLDGEALYVSIDSGGSSPRTVDGDSFDLYRVRANASFRWDDAVVERVTVGFERYNPAMAGTDTGRLGA
jgi:hypothetical protein